MFEGFFLNSATMFFFSVLDERALDLGRALPKKTYVFFCPALDCCRFPEKKQSISKDKKPFEKNKFISRDKNYFPAMFFLLVFCRPH